MKMSFKASLGFFATLTLTFIVLSGHKVSALTSGTFTGCFYDSVARRTHILGNASSTASFTESMPFVHVTIQEWRAPTLFPSYESLIDEPTNIRVGPSQTLTDNFDHIVLKDLNEGTLYLLSGLIRPINSDPPVAMGIDLAVFGYATIPKECLIPATSPPIGYFDSCALELGHTVIRGWAYDPDSTTSLEPRVTIRINQTPVASVNPIGGQTFTDKDLRTADIHTFLNKNGYPLDPQVEFFGFEFIVPAGPYKPNLYLLSGTIQNVGGGTDAAIKFGLDPPLGDNPFGLSAIPQRCLPDKPPDTSCPKCAPASAVNTKGGLTGSHFIDPFDSPDVVHQAINVPKGDLTAFGADSSISTILKLVLGLAGGVALLVVVLAGFRFVTSQGNPEATTKSRNTIIYALIGLVVCTLAYSIVTFVLERLS